MANRIGAWPVTVVTAAIVAADEAVTRTAAR
jgi:hypothetical protein